MVGTLQSKDFGVESSQGRRSLFAAAGGPRSGRAGRLAAARGAQRSGADRGGEGGPCRVSGRLPLCLPDPARNHAPD